MVKHNKDDDESEAAKDRVLVAGKPNYEQCNNTVISARYTIWNFIPKAVLEQFRRFANVYFLCVGCVMFVGTYFPHLYRSAISPWTTLGPLSIVISISLFVEGFSDYKRHLNDDQVNKAGCVVLKRAEELDDDEFAEKYNNRRRDNEQKRDESICDGRDVLVDINKAYYSAGSTSNVRGARARTMTDPQDPNRHIVKIAFAKVKRKDIRQGQLVLVKNREMVPADMLLLASANDRGGAYIETSSIDGETNLKLRNRPHLPKKVLRALQDGNDEQMRAIHETTSKEEMPQQQQQQQQQEDEQRAPKLQPEFESVDAAVKRLTRFSALGRPEASSALEHPSVYEDHPDGDSSDGQQQQHLHQRTHSGLKDMMKDLGSRSPVKSHRKSRSKRNQYQQREDDGKYVAALTTEPPNASVHTFSGKLTLPPFGEGRCHEIPLGPDNVLLRGAVIRNTEWVIGMAFFTGGDTKLVQNSFETPSKFSQLDRLVNKTVLFILLLMGLIISYLATAAVITNNESFDDLFYVGYNTNENEKWPYFPESLKEVVPPPDWETKPYNWIQYFFMFITLLSNFIPLSMYVTVEMIQFFMLWLIYVDIEMYDDRTDTRALARSTNVSDLGRIQYIFSDKTGTLTQNVMRFKRCSVDGMAFGAPIERMRPNAANDAGTSTETREETSSFHPLRHLLVGRIGRPSQEPGLEGLGDSAAFTNDDKKPTFNAEMFLRVMSLCHTVVVEKDIENKDHISGNISTTSSHTSAKSITSFAKSLIRGNRKRTDTTGSASVGSPPLRVVAEDMESEHDDSASPDILFNRNRLDSGYSLAPGEDMKTAKNSDGAPLGFAFQAESPDEGALVSAASKTFGFQVVGRDLNGIQLRCSFPSHLQDADVVSGLKSKSLSLDRLAAQTAVEPSSLPGRDRVSSSDSSLPRSIGSAELRDETWTILAVNKFDSDRKRMSILLRSPPELGNLPILFCKGADSAMLDPQICGGTAALFPDEILHSQRLQGTPENQENNVVDDIGYGIAHMLGIQVHLGEFAKEGLRTLVLGMRILAESECKEWMKEYEAAAVSLKDRGALLSEAAKKIEKDLYIVGATAIEDKLQRDVPDTIATLEKAGIKLWVLTGDKRETAVEIGYSTHVLTSKMHLTEVPDHGQQHVRTQIAMEFIRLIKHGQLPDYQTVALADVGPWTCKQRLRRTAVVMKFRFGKIRRRVRRWLMRLITSVMQIIGMKKLAGKKLKQVAELQAAEGKIIPTLERRRNVRKQADRTVKSWRQMARQEASHGPSSKERPSDSADDLALSTDEVPAVFNRAMSARTLLNDIRGSGELSNVEIRQLSLAYLTAQQAEESGSKQYALIDEDTLSLDSFLPESSGDLRGEFDKKKRTILERMFAVDRDVRKGRLKKHMRSERLAALSEGKDRGLTPDDQDSGPRALVIEGAALKHLLGHPEFEEILFAVASNCDAVIACRVSPKQKAELLNLVRRNIDPEPITLAIGDGANDVGMIQEAHVGVGISGKEGQQAVNASDFAIAQFRFLETLVLIHGRWNFFRLSTVVLFSFYKNAVMAGTIIAFASRTVFSGTTIFDEWVIAMLNFVAAWPILFLGFFDRCLTKNYIRKHPEVYRATRENELITFRTLMRWILICLLHIMMLYLLSIPQQSYGGGMSSGYSGMMANEDTSTPGDGEGGDLLSVGTVTYTCMIILLAYKVLYESRSLLHGKWPAFTCRKDIGEGFFNRVAYTWIGVTYLSVGFYLWAIAIYEIIGRNGAGEFSGFTQVTTHMMTTRTMSWILILFVPFMMIGADVIFKLFSNMFFPTQTQIHLEMEAKEKRESKRTLRQARQMRWTANRNSSESENNQGNVEFSEVEA